MRRFVVLVLAGCSATRPPPVKTAVPPASAVEQACVADCEAPVEPEVKYIAPDEEREEALEGNPDEVTCRVVGHAMASLELGYHADVDVLAPRITAYEKECVRLRLDLATRVCVVEQRDWASVAYCAPAIVPAGSGPPMFAAAECAGLFAEIERRFPASAYAPERRGWDTRVPHYLASCKSGKWTEQFASCVRSSRPDHCHYYAVPPLRTALDAILIREQQDRALRDAAFADPKKHPDVRIPRLSAAECRALVRETTKRVAARGPGDWQHAWWPPRAPAFEKSCIADRWPRELGGCVGELDINQCMDLAPSALQAKLYAIYNAPPR